MAWTRSLLKSKFKALAIHLGISAAIFVPLLWLIWFVWFPPPCFFTDGGWQGVRIMLVVDMVIGPVLTFLVFNPSKTRLALTVDYTFICLVQAAALLYGYVSVESKRVMAVAYHEGVFTAVTKDRYQEQHFDRAEWAALGDGAPYWVYARDPKNADEQAAVMAFAFTAGIAPHELFLLYDPLSAHAAQMKAGGEDYSALLKREKNLQPPAQPPPDGLRFFKLNGYFKIAYLGLDDQLRPVTTLYSSEKAEK